MRTVVKDMKSVLRNVDNGVPQGSVLAPILFMYSKTSLLAQLPFARPSFAFIIPSFALVILPFAHCTPHH